MSNKVRPSWTSVYKNYPQIAIHQEVPTVEIFKQLFGSKYNTATQLLTITEKNSAGKIITKPPVLLDNACATRVSIALTLAGHDIKSAPKASVDFYANQEATLSPLLSQASQ